MSQKILDILKERASLKQMEFFDTYLFMWNVFYQLARQLDIHNICITQELPRMSTNQPFLL